MHTETHLLTAYQISTQFPTKKLAPFARELMALALGAICRPIGSHSRHATFCTDKLRILPAGQSFRLKSHRMDPISVEALVDGSS